jgi:galactokinase
VKFDIYAAHREEFGDDPVGVFSAPGIIPLLGEHGEHSDGRVLFAAIEPRMVVAVSPRRDPSLRFFAHHLGERKRTTINNLRYRREDRWANLPKGVMAALKERGVKPRGINVTISGNVPIASGLGASSAIAVAFGAAYVRAIESTIPFSELPECGFEAERDFMQISSTRVDHYGALLAREGAFGVFDSRLGLVSNLETRLASARLLICDSQVPSHFSDEESNARVEAIRGCMDSLSTNSTQTVLRDFSSAEIQESLGLIPEEVRRRCLHIVGEEDRIDEIRNLLAVGDLEAVGKLLNGSHDSLRDRYEVSCPEVDWLVKHAADVPGVYGSRMTGRGFGGCIVSLAEAESLDPLIERLHEYERIFGFRMNTFATDLAPGLAEVYPSNANTPNK